MKAQRAAAEGPTPTSVGKSVSLVPPLLGPGTYPHVRGEETSRSSPSSSPVDLPPRPWGGDLLRLSNLAEAGPTPTSVGRRMSAWSSIAFARTYPHVRGEEFCQRVNRRSPRDLPPRPWGGVLGTETSEFPQGPTPTSVGRSARRRGASRGRGTYPHVRGEELRQAPRVSCSPDLPPRPWGGVLHRSRGEWRPGPTPTSVGRSASERL